MTKASRLAGLSLPLSVMTSKYLHTNVMRNRVPLFSPFLCTLVSSVWGYMLGHFIKHGQVYAHVAPLVQSTRARRKRRERERRRKGECDYYFLGHLDFYYVPGFVCVSIYSYGTILLARPHFTPFSLTPPPFPSNTDALPAWC